MNMVLNMRESESDICCIFNYAPHYRSQIYLMMEKELSCRFYFGDDCGSLIKKMDYKLFSNPVNELRTISLLLPFTFTKGVVTLFFNSKNKKFLLTGEPYSLSTWLVAILCFFSTKKVYMWTHGWYGRESITKKIVKKIFFGLCDGILLYGDYAKKLMIREGFSENKLFVLNNSLDYDNHLNLRKSLGKSSLYSNIFYNDYPVVIFIGRLTPIKKLDQLIDASFVNFNNGNLYNVCVIGDGPELDCLKQKANRSEFSNQFYFHGACYDDTVISEYVYNADLCVSPGNVGLTAIHSLSFGTPVVSHNDFANQMPEFEAIKPGLTGDFFEKDNIDDLANVINLNINLKRSSNIIQENCFKIIDTEYNPTYQLHVLTLVLRDNENSSN